MTDRAKDFPMKSQFSYLGIAILFCLTSPAVAETSLGASLPAKAQSQVPLQVTIVKRDAHENIISVQKVELAQAIALASQLVPNELSNNDSDIKSITINYN